MISKGSVEYTKIQRNGHIKKANVLSVCHPKGDPRTAARTSPGNFSDVQNYLQNQTLYFRKITT